MSGKLTPPRWATKFLLWFCNDHLAEAVLGDLTDLYMRRVNTIGKRKADLLFVLNIIQFIQPFALRKPRRSTQNHISMYKNFMTIASRTMAKQKMYTAIKVGGFALGLATCIVIALYVRHEINFDKHYTRANDIYRVVNEMGGPDPGKWTAFPAPYTPLLRENFPEVELAARLIPYKWFNAGSNLIKKEKEVENFYEEGFAYADPELLQILEVPMVYGSQTTALSRPNSIVLSREKADKYFPG
jgi:putative ABC transport system permease protein